MLIVWCAVGAKMFQIFLLIFFLFVGVVQPMNQPVEGIVVHAEPLITCAPMPYHITNLLNGENPLHLQMQQACTLVRARNESFQTAAELDQYYRDLQAQWNRRIDQKNIALFEFASMQKHHVRVKFAQKLEPHYRHVAEIFQSQHHIDLASAVCSATIVAGGVFGLIKTQSRWADCGIIALSGLLLYHKSLLVDKKRQPLQQDHAATRESIAKIFTEKFLENEQIDLGLKNAQNAMLRQADVMMQDLRQHAHYLLECRQRQNKLRKQQEQAAQEQQQLQAQLEAARRASRGDLPMVLQPTSDDQPPSSQHSVNVQPTSSGSNTLQRVVTDLRSVASWMMSR